MRVPIAVPLLCTLLSTGFVPGGMDPPCEPRAAIDTGTWQVIQTGATSFRIPPDYELKADESIDSDAREWGSQRGQVVRIDYGLYTGPFVPGPYSGMREPIIECKSGDGTEAPQVVLYRTADKRQAVGLYWVVPGGRAIPLGPNRELQREALWLEATSPTERDLPELLAIVQSTSLRSKPR